MALVRTNKKYSIDGAERASSSVKISYGSTSAVHQPNAIIERFFKNKLAKNYSQKEKIKLIDYVSDLCLYYPEKDPIETISTAISQRWLKEEKSSRKWSLENYINFIFNEYSNSTDELMSYILSDKWEIFQKKMESRSKKIKEGLRQYIEGEIEVLKNALTPLERERETHKDFID